MVHQTDSIAAEDFPWEKFLVFYNKLTSRIEVERVFCELTRQPFNQDPNRRLRSMTSDQLVSFLNEHQRDPRLNEILYPYADTSRALEIIAQYEPNPVNVSKGVLGPDGFLNYLLGEDNTVISFEKLDLYEDMEQPLSHYFINSSHNTYLIGHQLTGKSSVEMYRQCLLAGCRCVELDFWNGRTEEPVIVHGFTLVPEISAKDVIEAIGECAFKTSEWPVILSFENHCNPRQQAKIAQYCREFFGDMLLDSPLDIYPLEPGQPLPPPSFLKRKIIIKNKKKHRAHQKRGAHLHGMPSVGESQFHVDLNHGDQKEVHRLVPEAQGNGEIPRPPLEKESSRESYPEELDVANAVDLPPGEIPEGIPEEDVSSSSDDEDEGSVPAEERQNSRRVSKQDTLAAEEEAGAEISALVNYVQPVHFTSFDVSEKRGKSYEMSSFVENQSLSLLKEQPIEFVNYNKRQLSRVYPKGTRVDSSNFLPHQFWNAGCQLVALNYQTLDLPMQLNLGIFEYNSRSGYLLKPDFMRRPDRRFDPFAESTVDGIIAGTISVRVISGQFLSDKRSGCYVEVEMYGLPTDTVRKRFRTRTIPNNTMNPAWEEEPFVFKKVVLPEMATVRIAAYEENSKSILGHRVLPLVGLRPGYKHICLRNEKGQTLGLATLFVHIKVGDYVPDGLSDFAEALANPIKYQNEIEKRSHQLEVFEDDDEKGEDGGSNGPPCHTQPSLNNQPDRPTPEPPSGLPGSRKSEGNTSTSKPDTPPARRQNSICQKPTITAKGSEERATVIDLPPLALETVEIKAEDLDKLWELKSVKEKRKKIEKELKEVEQKMERKRQSLLQDLEKSKGRLEKSHSKLVKKISMKSSSDGSQKKRCGEISSHEEEHTARLQELKDTYKSSLVRLHQEQLLQEKRIQEENHEPLYNLLDKVLRASQQTQAKALQTLHNNGVEEMKKRQHEYHKEQIKILTKSTTDKLELERKKREVCQDLVTKGTQDRQRLIEIYERKKTDLEKQHEDIRQKFKEEKLKAYENIQKTYEEKVEKINQEIFENL
ncbi:UNVERIFIED_CONTAM: hypothetical protein RMT77_006222 [Armadillidium vulgare]